MTDATFVAAASLVADIAPYALAIVGALTPIAVGWLAAEVRKLTGLQMQQSAIDKLDSMIEAEAGALVAAASDNFATASIPVGSPIVADIAKRVLANAPAVLAADGLTTDVVATKVAGAIGRLQARMTTVTPATASTPTPQAAAPVATHAAG